MCTCQWNTRSLLLFILQNQVINEIISSLPTRLEVIRNTTINQMSVLSNTLFSSCTCSNRSNHYIFTSIIKIFMKDYPSTALIRWNNTYPTLINQNICVIYLFYQLSGLATCCKTKKYTNSFKSVGQVCIKHRHRKYGICTKEFSCSLRQ